MFALRKFLDRFAGRSAVMGIVNVTGDSFSEGIYSTPDSAVDRAEQLLADGADLLDVGAESTRPGASEVSVQNEIHRLIPVIEIIMRRHPGVVLSIDTRHAETADAALSAGAGIINDVSMLNFSPGMAEVVAKHGAGLILNHSRSTPDIMQSEKFTTYPRGVAAEVAEELAAAKAKAVAAGVEPDNILLDPGIGFAKNSEQCWELLRNLTAVDKPERMAVGISRKSFLAAVTAEARPRERDSETLAVELELAKRKIAMIRTHDVKSLVKALRVLAHFNLES